MEDDACLDQLLFLLFRSGCLVRHCNEKATLKIVSPFLSFLTRAALFDIYNSHPPCSLFFAFLLSIPLCHPLPKPNRSHLSFLLSYQFPHLYPQPRLVLYFHVKRYFILFSKIATTFSFACVDTSLKSLSVLLLLLHHHRTFVPLQPMPSLPRLDPTK